MPLRELLNSVSIKIDGRGELHASKLRAMSILSDLEIPSIFSFWRYDHLMNYLGLKQQPFPDGMMAIRETVIGLMPEKYRQNRLAVYIFPWIIFAELVSTGSTVTTPPPPEEQPAIAPEPVSDKVHYWLLYCNGENWNFNTYKYSQELYYHSPSSESPDTYNFKSFKRVQEGDIIVAYSHPQPASAFAVFEVTNGINRLRQNGDQINFKLATQFSPAIPWSVIETKISDQLKLQMASEWRLLSIAPEDYKAILGAQEIPFTNTNFFTVL